MASQSKLISRAELRKLANDRHTIRIVHRANMDAPPTTLFTAFPCQVLAYFAKSFRNDKTVREFVVVGVAAEAYRMILRWMLNCCSGPAAMRPVPTVPERKYFKYTLLLHAAEALQVEHIISEMRSRLNYIASRQVHSDDVRLVYTTFPASSPVRAQVVQSIGTALWEHRLLAKPVYSQLQRELPDFKQGLDEFFASKRQTRAEERQKNKAQPKQQPSPPSAGAALSQHHQHRDRQEEWQQKVDRECQALKAARFRRRVVPKGRFQTKPKET